MKRFFIYIIVFFFSFLYAANYAPDLLDKTSGLEHIGAGYTGVARPFTLSAPYWNPAGLYLLDKETIGFNYYTQLEEIHHTSIDGFLNYSQNLKLGFNFVQEEISDIPETVEVGSEGVKVDTFSDSYRIYNVSAATRLQAGTYGGLNFKLLTRSIADYSASGYGIDIGLINILDEDNSFGLNLKNIISGLSWSTSLEEMLERKIVVGYSHRSKLAGRNFFMDVDYEFFTFDATKNTWFLGCEYWLIDDQFAWRGGFNGYRQFTLGLGFNYRDFKTDVAYVVPEDNFANMLLFSLSFSFRLNQQNKPQEIMEDNEQSLSTEEFLNGYEIVGEGLVLELKNYESLAKIAVIAPNKDVVYYLPEGFKSGQLDVSGNVSGSYTLFYQRQDGKIFKQRISL